MADDATGSPARSTPPPIERRLPVQEVAPVLDAARRAGAWTPTTTSVLFHDLGRMEADLALLGTLFPPGAVHGIAIKANPLVEVLRAIVEAGCGLEAASWEEVELARAAGCDGSRIIFDSPAKTDEELRAALALGAWINADHDDELARIARIGVPADARIGLRVNPASGAGSIGFTSTVTADAKFGVPLERAAELVAAYPFVSGLHVHTGSQGVGLELIAAASRAVSEMVEAIDLDWIDVGGGLPVRYTDDDPEPPTLYQWADALSTMPSWGRRTVLTELGRWVHAGRGWALSRIEAVKEIDGVPTLVVHLGADLLLRRVYQPESWDHEMVVLDPDGVPRPGRPIETSVAGPLCFSGDMLARRRPLAPARRGDLVLIRDVGAYTMSMWSRHCSRGLPAVWGHRDTDVVPLFAGESPRDVVDFWSLR